MNVNKALTMEYEKKTLGGMGKTNPKRTQTNPIKANFRKAKMNVTAFQAKEYENISNCSLAENKANIMPKQTPYKAKQTQPVVSLPALPALSAVEGSLSKGSNLFQRQKNAALHLYPVGYLRKK